MPEESSFSKSGSYGWAAPDKIKVQKLSTNTDCDAIVIGGGMSGVATAHALQKSGRQTVLLEARRIGSGSTGCSAGILSASTTIDLRALEQVIGKDSAGRLFSLIQETIEEVGQTFGGASQWQRGSAFYVAARPSHNDDVELEAETLLQHEHRAKVHAESGLKAHWRGFGAAAEIPGQSSANPALLTSNIAQAFVALGGLLSEETPAWQWRHDGKNFVVDTPRATIRARDLIVCTGTGFAGLGTLNTAQRKLLLTVSGDIAVTEPSEHVKQLLRDTSCIALWDTLHLYHYVRYLEDGRMLIGGGENVGSVSNQALKPSDPAVRSLHKWASDHHAFPVPKVERAWRASLVLPANGLPAINWKRVGTGHLVSIVPDGLPFSFLVGKAVAAHLTDDRDLLPELQKAELAGATISGALLSWLPENSRVRKASLQLAIAALKIYDAVF